LAFSGPPLDNFNAFYKKYKTVFPTQTRAGMLNLLYHQKLYEAKLQFVSLSSLYQNSRGTSTAVENFTNIINK
jgi:hypothetical protein